ncbi:MAG: MipA/OmpV family protein [Granulosicoccus sp.]
MCKSSEYLRLRAPGLRVRLTCALGLIFVSSVSLAGNSSSDLNIDSQSRNENGGFFELGVVVEGGRFIRHRLDPDESDDISLGVGLDFSAGYRYGPLFVEATQSSFGGLNAGITIVENEHWELDFLLATISGNVTVESDEPPAPVTESERNKALVERDDLYIAAGARVTGYFDDNIVQLVLGSDWYEGSGVLGSLRAGRQWQLGNWNAQAIASVGYQSSEFNDYQYGIDVDEQSERFPAYSPGNAWIPRVEFGLSVPLKENWVYTSRIRYTQYPDSVADSPLVNRNEAFSLRTGIYYVF